MVSIETPVEIKLSLGNPIYRGPEGKTPVKGVDYFTQEDINDIVAQIEGGEGIDLSSYATKVYVDEAVENIEIPETDLTDYATKIYVDSAIEGVVVEETDPTVPSWAKQANKPTYTAQEVGALPANTALFSGDYNDLSNKPTLAPTPIVIQVGIAGQPSVVNGVYRLPLAITSNNLAEAYAQYQTHPSTVGMAVDLTAMGTPTKLYLDCESFYRYDDGNGGYDYETYGEFNDSSLAQQFGYEFMNVIIRLSTISGYYGQLTGIATTNQLSSYATKSYVETAIRGAESGLLKRSVVQVLPVSDIDEDTIYMVAKTGSTGDVYDEYLYVNSNWEHIGSTDVDLTDYRKAVYLETSENLDAESIAILNEIYNHIVSLNLSNNRNSNVLPSYDIFVNGEHIEYFKKYNTTITLLTGFYGADNFQKHQYVWTKDETRLWANGVSSISGNNLSVASENSVAGAYPNNSIGTNFKYIKDNYATQSYVDTAMPEYLTNTDILAIWNGNNE